MITKTGVISDIHCPYEDKNAVELCLQAFESIDVDRIIILGDLLDAYNVSMHGAKNPDVIESLQDEMDYVKEWLISLRNRFKRQHIVYLEGNHSNRIERYILANAKPFHNMITPKKYFNLEDLDIEWHDYQDVYQVENCNLYAVHSPPSYGKNHAMTSLERKLDASFIYGCSHRAQVAHRTGANGSIYSAYMMGWLGDRTKKVFEYAKGHDSWQLSCGMITVINGKDFNVEISVIRDNTLTIDGKTFTQD